LFDESRDDRAHQCQSTRDGRPLTLGGVSKKPGALAVVLTAILAALVALAANRPTSLTTPSSTAEPTAISYEIDHLFQAQRRPPNLELAPARAEAGRILLTSSSHSGVSPDDRRYLVQLVTVSTGLAGADAERRVDTVIAD